jgi:hypothetical protein
MSRSVLSTAFALLVVSLFTACGSPSQPSDVLQVRATTSFGFCVGYCRTTLEITPTEAVYTREGWRGEPPIVRREPLASSDWSDLTRAVDRDRLGALPDVIGCPDCADAGAESVGVVAVDWTKTVTFDHGAVVPTIQSLLGRVRAIRGRFEQVSSPPRP